MVVILESAGQKFMFLNGGPEYTLNPSISIFVLCETQTEVDNAWKMLTDGGSVLMPLDKYDWSSNYGWVQDRFGISWQLSLGRMQDVGQKFTPFLMFTGKQSGRAEEAIRFYTSTFKDSEIVGILRYTKEEQDVEGTVKQGQYRLEDQVFMVMDSSRGHQFSFNEAISIVVECDSQDEIDFYWNALSKGGDEGQCGWLKDKFGVSWQIVPAILKELMSDPARSERVIQAFLQMRKFDIGKLVNA